MKPPRFPTVEGSGVSYAFPSPTDLLRLPVETYRPRVFAPPQGLSEKGTFEDQSGISAEQSDDAVQTARERFSNGRG